MGQSGCRIDGVGLTCPRTLTNFAMAVVSPACTHTEISTTQHIVADNKEGPTNIKQYQTSTDYCIVLSGTNNDNVRQFARFILINAHHGSRAYLQC